jgi:hypothetical protein
MSTATLSYGSNQALTITVASLANNALRQSTEVDNTSNGYLTGTLGVKIKTGASGTAAAGYVNVWAWANSNDIRDGLAGASDAAIASNTGLRFVGRIAVAANATTYTKTFDLSEVFGGSLPPKWGIVLENKTGAALDSTAGSHAVGFIPANVAVA